MPKKSIFHKLQTKRYRPDKYRNPYFRGREQRQRWKLLGMLALAVLAIVGVVYFFFFTNTFAIQRVDVSGTETIDPAQIESIAKTYLSETSLIIFSHTNRFIFDTMTLKDRLNASYAFKSLSIDVEESVLKIAIEEKTSQLMWRTDGVAYLVDLEGVIIRPLTESELTLRAVPPPEIPARLHTDGNADGEEGPKEEKSTYTEQEIRRIKHLHNLPVFEDMNGESAEPGDSVLTAEEIQNISRFRDHLNEQGIGHQTVVVDRLAGRWVGVETIDGYQILFDPLGDIDLQALNLQTVLRERVDDPTELQYIDLRFDDHVYIK